jgi:hypothetical protein
MIQRISLNGVCGDFLMPDPPAEEVTGNANLQALWRGHEE